MNSTKSLVNIFILFIFLFLVCGKGMAMPIFPEIKSVVCFVFIEKDTKLIPNGTAFFVIIKDPSKPTSGHGYLVTAKHVLLKPDTTEFFDKVYVRLNKKSGGSEIITIPIKTQGDDQTVFVHYDSSVDLAVIPFFPDITRFDYKFVNEEMITTEEDYVKLKIREGSDIFFTGLFTPFPGAEKNYPIVRYGRVSLVTDEKINWGGIPTTLYLVEAGSFGGNSGAPVFFYLGSDREPGKVNVGPVIISLAGIMQGTFLDAHEIKVISTKTIPISLSSMGIAAVVPAYKLHELLFSEQLKRKRGF